VSHFYIHTSGGARRWIVSGNVTVAHPRAATGPVRVVICPCAPTHRPSTLSCPLSSHTTTVYPFQADNMRIRDAVQFHCVGLTHSAAVKLAPRCSAAVASPRYSGRPAAEERSPHRGAVIAPPQSSSTVARRRAASPRRRAAVAPPRSSGRPADYSAALHTTLLRSVLQVH
jgi:hypothetical protein